MSHFRLRFLTLILMLLGAGGVAAIEPPGEGQGAALAGQPTDISGFQLPPGAVARLGALRLQHAGSVSNLLFTSDGKSLISAGGESVIRIWDSSTGQEIRRFVGHEAPVCSIALTSDGMILASGGEDHTIRLWGVPTGRELKHWPIAEDARPLVAFSPNGKVLASGGSGSSFVLWDVNTGKEIRQFKGQENERDRWRRSEGGSISSLAFTPDGRRILSAQPGGLILWDLTTGKRLRNYETSSQGGWSIGNRWGNVTSLDVSKAISFSADGEAFIAPGDQNGEIHIWELDALEERGRLLGHESVLLAARYSPDGKKLASAAHDGTLRT